MHEHWWPIALAKDIKSDKVYARTVLGTPLVLFRANNNSIAVLPDRCPHRHAPLSLGKVHHGEIECPYHGWRFNQQGWCTQVPGNPQEARSSPLLDTPETCEAHGLVWVRLEKHRDQPPPTPPTETQQTTDAFYMTTTLHCTLLEAAENFLDGFHTHFVHAGWIRRDAQRQTVTAEVTRLNDGVEARYTGEKVQSGFISTLFERSRGESMGRFRLPGLAEIEYRNRQGELTLLISVWLTPVSHEQQHIHARIATPKGLIPHGLKQVVLKRFFNVILRQDRHILEKTRENINRHNRRGFGNHTQPEQLNSELDLLGPWIKQLLAGSDLSDFKETTLKVSL